MSPARPPPTLPSERLAGNPPGSVIPTGDFQQKLSERAFDPGMASASVWVVGDILFSLLGLAPSVLGPLLLALVEAGLAIPGS